jgi:ribosomal protein L40E
MMKMKVLLVALVLVCAVSCGKTVDSEKSSWASNLKNLSALSFEYPAFADVIKAQIALAEPVMQEAGSIADEEAKIKKMSEANLLLRPDFVRHLGEVKGLKETVRKKIIDARALKADESELRAVNQAVYDAERAMREADGKLRGTVSSRLDADTLSGIVLADLKTVDGNLDHVIRMVGSRLDSEKKLAEDKAKQARDAEQKKVDATKPVECAYCGAMNPPDAVTCKGCGAGLEKK